MKLLSKVMGISGVIALLSAAGNDDITGGGYPWNKLITSVVLGFVLIGSGLLINARCEK